MNLERTMSVRCDHNLCVQTKARHTPGGQSWHGHNHGCVVLEERQTKMLLEGQLRGHSTLPAPGLQTADATVLRTCTATSPWTRPFSKQLAGRQLSNLPADPLRASD